MIAVVGGEHRGFCDGITRRDILRIGGRLVSLHELEGIPQAGCGGGI